MDPEAALIRIRELAAKLIQGDNEEWSTLQARAVELAETISGLDEWLCKDGHFPRDWHTKEAGR